MAGQTPRRGLRLNQPEPMALLTVHGFEAARRKTVSAIRAHDVREPGAGLGRPGRPERTPRCRPIAARRPAVDHLAQGPAVPRGKRQPPLPRQRARARPPDTSGFAVPSARSPSPTHSGRPPTPRV
ncbi:hypothetical protein [Streptomyces flaveolus]|uniref:hypothetical protein n=1 Tax=Streptomyces flaveolus TaxID=67297 RepID=UPI003F4D59DC